MMDKLKCHICGHYQVYAEHIIKEEKWRFFCRHCGKTTKYYNTYDAAQKEWDKMEVEE